MKKLIPLIALFFLFSVSFSQATVKKYFLFETSGEALTNPVAQTWKPEVPYKHFVRLVSEPFDYPKEWNSLNDIDVKVQFVEYLMKTNPEVIRKMRLHTLGTFQKVPHDPNNPDDARQYRYYTTNAKPGNWTFEIIVIKGFKYEPGKYADVAAGKRKVPIYEEARRILYDAE